MNVAARRVISSGTEIEDDTRALHVRTAHHGIESRSEYSVLHPKVSIRIDRELLRGQHLGIAIGANPVPTAQDERCAIPSGVTFRRRAVTGVLHTIARFRAVECKGVRQARSGD